MQNQRDVTPIQTGDNPTDPCRQDETQASVGTNPFLPTNIVVAALAVASPTCPASVGPCKPLTTPSKPSEETCRRLPRAFSDNSKSPPSSSSGSRGFPSASRPGKGVETGTPDPVVAVVEAGSLPGIGLLPPRSPVVTSLGADPGVD